VVHARLGEPLFQRSPAHYTSHAQTPFDHLTDYAAVAHRGRLAATAFPIGTSYYRNGYWIYREVFRRLVRMVLPVQLVETNAPISAEISVTHQRTIGNMPERWMIHIVNFSPNQRTPEHCEYMEDPIPLHDLWMSLAIDTPIARAYLAAHGSPLALRTLNGRWQVDIPRIETSAIAVLECRF